MNKCPISSVLGQGIGGSPGIRVKGDDVLQKLDFHRKICLIRVRETALKTDTEIPEFFTTRLRLP